MREYALIARLTERLQRTREQTRLAIGDDAAVIAPPSGQELAVTTDTLISGRHFPQDTPAFDIGYKALAVNLSDLAAMGADPCWATVALTAPELDAPWCDDLIDGMCAAMGEARVDIIGGDTTRGALSITVTALGLLPDGGAITRAGAQPGDVIAVTGTLGDAALGLILWPQRGSQTGADSDYLLARLCRPAWRAGTAMRGRAHAAIDISDGLAADLGHVLTASGVGATIDVDCLPASAAYSGRVGHINERRRLQLTGGDDYELCIVLPESAFEATAAALGCALTRIGTIERPPGLRLVDAAGRPIASPGQGRLGWDHFS